MKVRDIKKRLYARNIPARLQAIKKLQGLAKIDLKNAIGIAQISKIDAKKIIPPEPQVEVVRKKDGASQGFFSQIVAEAMILKAKTQKKAALMIATPA